MDKLSQHEENAKKSKGISDNIIYNAILEELEESSKKDNLELADIGCGEGHLLNLISNQYKNINLSGVDIVEYPQNNVFKFVKHNFNESFEFATNTYDIALAIEVIEHLENPRHFIRELSKIIKPGGKIIVSTPNPYSILSILSFTLKGYHSSFGPKNYPAHITVVPLYHLENMINEVPNLEIEKSFFIPNGRIPGTKLQWTKVIPFLNGKRFSDNYYCVIKKI